MSRANSWQVPGAFKGLTPGSELKKPMRTQLMSEGHEAGFGGRGLLEEAGAYRQEHNMTALKIRSSTGRPIDLAVWSNSW